MRKEFKGFLTGVLLMTVLVILSTTVFAESISKMISVAYRDIQIVVDGDLIEPQDVNGNAVEPFIYNGSTYLPVRAVSEALGKEVEWIGETSSVYIGTPPTQEIIVSTAQEFVDAIGSNRTIILEPGIYNLSNVDQTNDDDYTVVWGSLYYEEGYELNIRNIDNLTIKGSDTGTTELVVSSRYAEIINFRYCRNIKIQNITAGHTPMEYRCDAGVLTFDHCRNVDISKSEFYGCGSIGLTIGHTTDLTCLDSDINHCSFKALLIEGSDNISFINTKIQNHEAYSDVIYVNNSPRVSFTGCDMINSNSFEWSFFRIIGTSKILIDSCKIDNNTQESELDWDEPAYFFEFVGFYGYRGGAVNIINTEFTNNSCNYLTDYYPAIAFENCTVDGNVWTY